MQQPSLFTRIINGEIPAHKIYEDDKVIAFLDLEPLNPGHTLVVPKVQVDQIWELDDENYKYLWKIVKKVGNHIHEVIGSTRVGVVVEGFGVPHVHVHLVPIYHGNDLKKFPKQGVESNDKSLAAMALRLKM